ncbi:MAG: 50S ribosomal protein L25/general stress protein Ctc [Alphaproteobacteria bacterium]|nr:50S ribosomal protein L25/general stress protein Ctc [Alphaproteobacteria bacterium]
MKTVYTFEAEQRERKGKGGSRQLRREGRLPAVLYGKGQDPLSFSIENKAFVAAYQKGGFNNKLVDIKLDGKSYHVLPREIQLHPVSDTPEHVDFLKVDENSRVHVNVPVKVLNADKCAGVKLGGALNMVRHDIELICAPDSIPGAIKVDVQSLAIGDSVHISAITLPKGSELAITDRDFTILTVAGRAPQVEIEEGEEGEEGTEATAEEGAEETAAEAESE